MHSKTSDMAFSIANKTFQESKECDFHGYDPFDGLNGRIFTIFPSLKAGSIGLIWLQFFKRSPVNLRWLAGVKKQRNPKGIALYILGLVEAYKISRNIQYIEYGIRLADWLLDQKCSKEIWKYNCWGYHFDWKAKAFYVPKGKPNVITTVYVAQALLSFSDVLINNFKAKSNLYREAAFDAAKFIVEDLYVESSTRNFFCYIPGELKFVHNASLWAAAWVCNVASKVNNTEYLTLALKAVRQSVVEQGEDGSWVYGSEPHHQFIDSFHTGYNLEALNIVRNALNTVEFDGPIKKGMRYYKENFFELDGLAKYYNNNRYPLDMHSVSQAILTLLKVGGEKEDYILSEKILEWSMKELYIPSKNRFVYQKKLMYTNKVDYIRWTRAWVYYSFMFYCRAVVERNGKN